MSRTVVFDTDTLALQSGTSYTVCATDQYGRTIEQTGTFSITEPATVPAAFVDANWSVATGAATGGQLDVTITTLPSNGGASITDVEYDLDASGTWVSSGGTTSFIITGLTASTSYAVRLRAVNSVGAGSAGNSESATSSAAAAAWATVSGTTGSPTILTDVDGDNLWDAYQFTASGSITLSAGKIGRRLWVGGGGGGGSDRGGGGGGGGIIIDNTEPEVAGGTYTITIGAGGTSGITSGALPTNGGDTVAFGQTAVGGGKGGSSRTSGDPGVGGSGGGGASSTTLAIYTGAAGTSGQGNAGGAGNSGGFGQGGGGGGAGAVGADHATNDGGDGGAGVSSDITGSSVTYGGGGGGFGPNGFGGAGGGGAGAASQSVSQTGGTDGLGGGAGGRGTFTGTPVPSGGSGVFIIRIRR